MPGGSILCTSTAWHTWHAQVVLLNELASLTAGTMTLTTADSEAQSERVGMFKVGHAAVAELVATCQLNSGHVVYCVACDTGITRNNIRKHRAKHIQANSEKGSLEHELKWRTRIGGDYAASGVQTPWHSQTNTRFLLTACYTSGACQLYLHARGV